MHRRSWFLLALCAGCVGCGSSSADEPALDEDAAVDSAAPGADAVAESDAEPGDVASGPPVVAPIADQTVAEDALLEIAIAVSGTARRVFVDGLPRGAQFDEAKRVLRFRPDFIQGGGEPSTVRVEAINAAGASKVEFKITVTDSVKPPALTVTKTEDLGSCTRLTLAQKTDSYTDSAGYAGRSFRAVATVPKAATAANRVPIRMRLHGAGGEPSAALPCSGHILIEPHDPMLSYWWGYAESLPGAAPSGKAPPYTARRVLQLVEWAQRTRNGDPLRTFIGGGSMGGAGAMAIGLLWARHFAGIDATIGQAIARNHRPSRVATLEKLWGTRAQNLDDGAGMGVWDRLDLTRALRDDQEAAGQFTFTKHGKDDPTIHFGAAVMASPLTKVSFYDALVTHPHYVVWDEGGHGSADPVMAAGWWDAGWSRVDDATAFLRVDRAVPAFAASSLDDDPGDGTGNGKVTFNAERGFAGNESVAGDTGWKGDIAGAKNRHLRWDAAKIVDARDRFEIPLRVLSGEGNNAPRDGYPTYDNKVAGTLPAKVNVTLRRTQAFRPLPGQKLSWELGAQKGEITVAENGVVTIPAVLLSATWATLVVRELPG